MISTIQSTLSLSTHFETLTVQTSRKQEMINLTVQLAERVAASGIRNGFAGLFTQHTTAALLVNEWQAALLDDMAAFLQRFVEERPDYKHNSPLYSDCDRQNATSHLRSLMFSNSVMLPVVNGELVLGQFQSVILAELDGPRERTLKLQLMGEGI